MSELILKNVTYRYPGTKRDILKGVNTVFPEGKLIAVCGRSGAGKSTLLYLLSGLDVPREGEILYNGAPLEKKMLDSYRRKDAATIAQSYLLFPTRTVLENVLYPLQLTKTPKDKAMEKAKESLALVGLGEELHHRLPGKLSGGEQQRVAIARCLCADAHVIAADEPTGNLDEENSDGVLELLKELAHTHGKTVVVVTHDTYLAKQCDLRFRLRNGVLEEEE